MLREELHGLEKQIEECLTCAFQKGYNTGTVDRVPDVEKAYERGLKEAWECVDKIAMLPTDITEPMFNQFGLHNIIKNVSPAEAINKIYEYEKQQQVKKTKEEAMITERTLMELINNLTPKDKLRLMQCITCEHDPKTCGKGDSDEDKEGFCKHYLAQCSENSVFGYLLMKRRK